jgi:hypothetical protein
MRTVLLNETMPSRSDTLPEAARVHLQVLKRLGPERRARMTFDLSDSLRELLATGVRMRHPDYDSRQVRLAATRLAIGEQLFRAAFPDQDVRP